jgi:hypothetical protein
LSGLYTSCESVTFGRAGRAQGNVWAGAKVDLGMFVDERAG